VGLELGGDLAIAVSAGFVASVALRVLGRPSEVDDLVQDVFPRVMPGSATCASRRRCAAGSR
jgi:DNA-directed RNA polymerase specialized sigma24 family protein